MISITELIPIGTIVKPHGLRGEMSVELDGDCDTEGLDHAVLRIDGIFVPFRIAAQRPRGSLGALLTFDGVDDADAAAEYTGHELYALRRELPEPEEGDGEEGLYAEDLAGFTLTDPAGSMLGTIAHVDTTTMNTLLHVDLADGGEALVPLADDWICSIDADARQIAMDIPPALMNMA